MLEEAPDVMALKSSLLILSEQNLVPQSLVILLWSCVPLSQCVARLISILFLVVREHFEQTFSFVVVGDWVISELDE